MFCLETFILDYWEKETRTENQQLFDGIMDITIFDGVEGLDYLLSIIAQPMVLKDFSVFFSFL